MPYPRLRSAAFAISLSTLLCAPGTAIGAPRDAGDEQRSADAWAESVWNTAREGGNGLDLVHLLSDIPASVDEARVTNLRDSVGSWLENIQLREERREERMGEKRAEIARILGEELTDRTISDALREAVELQAISRNEESLLEEADIVTLINVANNAWEDAEDRGDWLTASELVARLRMLDERNETYREAIERLISRQAMINLYAPEHMWEIRNARRIADGDPELPPYNPRGKDYRERLEGVDSQLVLRALLNADRQHVDNAGSLQDMVIGGLDAVRLLGTTPDLEHAFDGLADADARSDFVSAIDSYRVAVERDPSFKPREFVKVLEKTISIADSTVGLKKEVVLHEFGVGAMSTLDDFSAIIWPHEMRQFERQTRGSFVGVGIQIRLDELSNILVVTPLEGTPAQRIGVRAGDIIRKVDGEGTAGFTLNQAVDVITGPANTNVTLTVEREVGEEIESIDFDITRKVIELPTVRGWSRAGAADDEWNYRIDPASSIGYVRLSGFTEKTSRDLDQAIRQMEDEGLEGFILDLRFNPGGLLSQAVAVSDRFIDDGTVVSTVDALNRTVQREKARRSRTKVSGIPMVVLVNENSASASEIVSGALQHYSDAGEIDAVVLGQRSFGKGSVQNVYGMPTGNNGTSAAMKLTTQYYQLPDGSILHRRPGDTEWGVEPDLHVDILPTELGEMLTIRQAADLPPAVDEFANPNEDDQPRDPQLLFDDGLDLQLQTAMVLLQTQLHDAPTLARPEAGPNASNN